MNWLYVVRDIIAQDVGNQVIVAKRDEVAVRAFFDALANPNPASVMAQHPEDYELLVVGSMESDGIIDNLGGPRVVATGKLFVQMREAERAKSLEVVK